MIGTNEKKKIDPSRIYRDGNWITWIMKSQSSRLDEDDKSIAIFVCDCLATM